MFANVVQLYSRRASSAVSSLVVTATVAALGVVLARDRVVNVQSRLLLLIAVQYVIYACDDRIRAVSTPQKWGLLLRLLA